MTDFAGGLVIAIKEIFKSKKTINYPFEKGKISLIKWHIQTDESGALRVVRKLLEGPQKLTDY